MKKMKTFRNAAISPAERGNLAVIAGLNTIRIASVDTGGALAAMEMIVPRGGGQSRHVHALEDEFLHVLRGRFGFWCGEEYVELDQGGCIALPRDVPHQFQNVGNTTGRLLVVITPGGFENFFPSLARHAAAGPADVGAIAARFGVSFLAPAQPRTA